MPMYAEDVVFKFPISDEKTARLLEENGTRHLRPPSPHTPEYKRRSNLGFYKNFTNIDDDLDGSTLLARKMACVVSRSVVALSCRNSDGLQQCSSGIVVEYKGTKKILTSAYIIGGHSNAFGLKIEILFPSGRKLDGSVSLIDHQHNVAFIHGDLDSIPGISLSLELASLDVNVMSLGRNSTFGLMTSRGKINIRRDVLESDDLMSSSCTISESGIGGPLVDISTGFVIGINVHMQRKSTLFMPSVILYHCFQQLLEYGQVRRPSLGLKTRNIGDKKLNEMERIYQKFPSTDALEGIVVTEVIMGSPAHKAQIYVGDIITLVNNIPVSSPVQLADSLLKLGRASLKRKRKSTDIKFADLHLDLHKVSRMKKSKRKHRVITVKIQRPGCNAMIGKTIKFKYSSPYVNSWPLFPLDIPVSECVVYDFVSYQRGTTLRNSVLIHDRAETPHSSVTNTSRVEEEHSHSDKTCTQDASFMIELQSARKNDVGSAGMNIPDAVIHRDAPLNHQFPTSMDSRLHPC